VVFGGFWWFSNGFCCAFDALRCILLKIVGPAEACLRGSHNFRYQHQDTAARREDWWMLVVFWGFLSAVDAFLCLFGGI